MQASDTGRRTSTGDAHAPDEPRKKPKVAIDSRRPLARGDACNSCRSRKVRCTGERPTCSNCTKRTRPCIYSEKRYMLSVVDPRDEAPPQINFMPSAPSVAPSSNGTSVPGSSDALPLLPLNDVSPLSLTVTPNSLPMVSPPFMNDMFQFNGFLPMMGGSPTGLSGQTLPPEYANIDLDELLRELEQDIQAAASTAPLEPVQPEPSGLTELEKEHLLWLYFSHQRMFCLEMHFATFWSRLQSENPNEQPHPCLLNAIYLVTCWASPSQTLRTRSATFYHDAYDALRQAVVKKDRMLDAARAGFLLSCYLYSMARFHEAATVAGMTFSIAIMYGLHIIPQSRFVPMAHPHKVLLRHSLRHVPPPTSQIELAERIYTFWSIFLLDRCASVSQDWPPGLAVDRVCTPLPRPWSEYENPDDLAHDETLFDVLQGRVPDTPATDLGQMIKGLEILFRSSQTGVNVPSPYESIAKYDAVWGSGPAAQHEKDMLINALDTFTEQLPAELKSVQLTKSGKSITNTTGTLQFVIGGSQMFLHDTNKYDDPNEAALAAVRRMLGVMHLLGDEEASFDSGLLVVMIWAKMGILLLRETLRLEKLGDTFGAANVDAELNTVINALKTRGQQFNLAKLQAYDLELMRQDSENYSPGCRTGSKL